MIPVSFKEQNGVTAGGDFMDLPRHFADGRHTTFWQCNEEDLKRIAERGGIWVEHIVPGPEFYPFRLMTESPFQKPNPMEIYEVIMDKVFIEFFDDLEVVFLKVDPDERDFQMEQVNDHQWMVTVKNPEYGDERFATNYIFGEPLKLMGLASEHYGRFDEALKILKLQAETTVILERINKTV